MRRLASPVLALAALLALPGCANLCEDWGLCDNTCEKLGARICTCSGGGTASSTCKQQVKNLLSDVGVHAEDKNFCGARLDTCNVPASLGSEAQFCEWVNTDCGKVSCGLAYGDPADPAICPTSP